MGSSILLFKIQIYKRFCFTVNPISPSSSSAINVLSTICRKSVYNTLCKKIPFLESTGTRITKAQSPLMVHLSQAIFNEIELIVPLEGPGTKVLGAFYNWIERIHRLTPDILSEAHVIHNRTKGIFFFFNSRLVY